MKWIQSGSFIEPKKVDDTLSKTYVYIRTNIVKGNIEIDGNIHTYYSYSETVIPKEEYAPIAAVLLDTQDQTHENTIGIGNAEDAICELSETMDDAIAALEQAICDLSEEIGGEE